MIPVPSREWIFGNAVANLNTCTVLPSTGSSWNLLARSISYRGIVVED